MVDFEYILNGIDDNYATSLQRFQREYKYSLMAAVRLYLASHYPDFTGSIYFEVNRDFLSVAVNPHVPQHRMVESIQQNLHKNLCTLQPDLLQCLDDVTISI